MKFFFFLFLFLFIIPSLAFAIGISPPIINADYHEGDVYRFDVKIINNAAPGKLIRMTASGTLNEYVSFSETSFVFKSGEPFHTIHVTVDLPDYNSLPVYGKQKIYLRASEGSSSKAEGFFSVTTAVTGWFIVDIPVPGKYGVIDSFSISNSNKETDTPFTLILRNRGTQILSSSSVQITLFDYEKNKIESLSFDGIDILVDSTYDLTSVLPTGSYSSSKYFASAEFIFDPLKISSVKESSFFVGSTDIILLSYTEDISANTINKINLELQSVWGSPLRNIRGIITFDDVSQDLPVLDFNSFERKNLDAYIDLPASNKTNLDAILTFSIPVDNDVISEKIIPLTFNIVQEVKPTVESPIGTSSMMIFGLIFIVLLLVGVNVFIFMHRKHSKKR